MSVDSTHISQSFLMDGRTANFTFTFACLKTEPESVKVRKLNSVNPNTYSTLAYTTDYTVAVNSDNSGGVLTVVNTAGTDTLFVYRETSDKQESDYEDFNQFPADTLEQDLDRRTMRSQETEDGVNRALKFSISSSISGITLPVPVDQRSLKWSGTGGTLVNTDFPPDSAPSIAISAMTISMSAATASSISQIAAASSATVAATQATLASSYATIAGTYATLAISAANTALGANRTIDTLLITTNAVINIMTAGNLDVTTRGNIASLFAPLFSSTTANITGLTVGTLNITNMDTVTVGSITVTTDATIQMAVIENASIATLRITTAATANMMDMAVATAGMLLVTTSANVNLFTAGTVNITTRATISSAVITSLTATTVTLSSGTIAKEVNIGIATTGATPTFTTQADFNKLFGSAGRASGGTIASAGTDSISVGAGTGFIKSTDSDTATIISFDWASASSISVATNTTTYIYIDYNGGIPTIATTTVNNSWDLDTSFPLGSVVQEVGVCHILNNPWWVTDGTTNIIERADAMSLIFRDSNFGGLILSSTADRRIAVTAGKLWARLNEFSIPALATNSTFEIYWRTSSTVWVEEVVSTLSTINYNNLTTNTLTAIDNNKYVNWWVYAEADDASISLVYPQNQYLSAAEAEAVGSPSSLPKHIEKHGILIGRIIMQQGTTAPIETQSAFSTVFAASASADHGNLAGLSDDDHLQYVPVTGTRSATIPTLSITTSATIANLNSGLVTFGNLSVTSFATINLLTTGNLSVKTSASIASGTITNLYSGPSTIGSLIVTTGGVIGLLTSGNLNVTTTATISNGVITTLQSGLTTIGNLMVTTNSNFALATVGNLTVTSTATIAVGSVGLFTVGTLGVKTSATIANLTVTTATITSLTATTISYGTSINYPTIVKSVEIESPTASENITLFKVASAATITDMYAVVRGTSASTTWVIKHGTDRSGGGSSVNTAGTTTTDTTSGSTVTTFTDATIVANSWVWLVTTATAGTINSLNVTINYRMDA